MDLFHQSRILSNSMDKSFLPHLHFYHYHCCLRSRINVFADSYSEKSNCHCFAYTNKNRSELVLRHCMKKGRKRMKKRVKGGGGVALVNRALHNILFIPEHYTNPLTFVHSTLVVRKHRVVCVFYFYKMTILYLL